jgi:WD40 repeat protein
MRASQHRLYIWAVVLGILPGGLGAQDKAVQEKPTDIAKVELKRPADFAQDVLPILRKNCIACHHGPDAEGKLVLETPAAMLQGGESGPVILPAKPLESPLLLSASFRVKPFMPPKKNKVGAERLTAQELGIIKLWIEQGAKASVAAPIDPPKVKPPPASWNPIYDVALDQDGQYVACGRAGRLYIYHVPTGRLIDQPVDPKLSGFAGSGQPGFAHPDAIQSIAFSPDGGLLATGGYRSIKLWKRRLSEKKLTLDAGGEVTAAAVSPDGSRAALSGPDGVIRLFDLGSGKRTAELKGHKEAVAALRFSPDGAMLLSGSSDKTVRLWKTSDGGAIAIGETPAAVTAVEWLPDAKQVAVGGADGPVRLFAAPEKKEGEEPAKLAPAKELKGHTGPVTDLRSVPGTPPQLLSASADGHLRTWSLENGTSVRDLAHGVPIVSLAAGSDAKHSVSVGNNQGAKLWGDKAQALSDLKTDGAARRKDLLQAALLAFAGNEVTYRAGQVKANEDNKKKEDDELSKAIQAQADAQKALAEKADLLAKAVQEREGADAALAQAGRTIEAAKARADAAALALTRTDSDEALKQAQGEKAAADEGLKVAQQKAGAAKTKAEALAKSLAEATAVLEDAKKKSAEAAKAIAQAAEAFADGEAKKKAELAAKSLTEATQAIEDTRKRAEANKQTADLAMSDTQKIVDQAKERSDSAQRMMEIPKTGAALRQAEAEKAAADKTLADLSKAADASRANLETLAKTATENRALLERMTKALAESKSKFDAAEQALQAAGDDEQKKKQATDDKKAAEESVKKAETEKNACAMTADRIERERQAAEKSLAEAGKKKDEAKARAEAAAAAVGTAKAASDGSRKGVEADKTAAEKAMKAAETAQKDAATKRDAAKKAEESARAVQEQAKLGVESADRRAAKSKEAVQKSQQAIQESTQKLEAKKDEQKKLEAARKQSAENLPKALLALRVAAFSPDGTTLVLGAEDGRIYTFGSERGDEAAVLEAHGRPVLAAAFTPEGTLVSVGADGSVRRGRTVPTWKLERSIEPTDPSQPPVDFVMALTFSPDGKLLVSGGGVPSREGELVLWNVADGRIVRKLTDAHSDTVYDAAFSPDGSLLATGSADKFAKVFEVASGKLVRSFEGHTHHVLGVAWNRTGRTVASAGADGVVKIWDMSSGQQVKTVPGFEKQATSLKYLGFENTLAVSAGGGASVRLVREDGNAVRALDGGGGFMYAVSASADGAVVAAGGIDGVLRLWRSDKTQPIGVFSPPTAK